MSYRSVLESLPEQDDENIPIDANPVLQKIKSSRRKSRKRTPLSPGYDEAPLASRRNTSRNSSDLLDSSQDVLGSSRSNRIVNTSRNSGDLLETSTASGEYVLQHSSDSLEGGVTSQVKKNDKRHRICMEMCETEENYLRMLNIMIEKFKKPLDLVAGGPHEILTKQEIAMLFSKIPNLIQVHSKVCEDLHKMILNWDSTKSLVGRVWQAAFMDAKKFYPPYINSYDEAISMLDACVATKLSFRSFLREVESKPECQKNSLKDMLIRPVQRLPSVLLLLKELHKKTDKRHPDYDWVRQCITNLEDVLRMANEGRAKSEQYTKFFEICNSIEGFPPELIASERTFKQSIDLVLLEASGGPWKSVQGRVVSFFLFNTFIAIAKRRSTVELDNSFRSTSSMFSKTSTMSALTLPRSTFMGFRRRERKNYKLIRIIRFAEFRDFDYYSPQGIFQMKMRDEKGDELCIFQVTEECYFELVMDFFNEVIKMISTDFPNRLLNFEDLTEEKLVALQNSRPEEFELLRRARKAAERYGDGTTDEPRASTLRRAVSNVSLSRISRGISRFASRSSIHKPNFNQSHFV